jgi:glycosyltransferase involved in cell wall biosynthesis
MNDSLTVVVPYYKRDYLDPSLASLARQVDQTFTVLVGDDASPQDPTEIIRKHESSIKIKYRRYDNNLGQTALAAHWNRCVRETSSEWIWLFSDDDLASEDCVGSFRRTLSETNGLFDVYRFKIKVIDAKETLIYDPPAPPLSETGAEFLFARMSEGRSSSGGEYIFRRSAFEAAEGFVAFPLAWFSDDASWIAFSRRSGIRTIDGGEVSWRQSDVNLSSPKPEHVGKKLAAFRSYLLWCKREFPDETLQRKLRVQAGAWFPRQIGLWGGEPRFMEGLRFWLFFSGFTRDCNYRLLRRFLGLRRFPKNGHALQKARSQSTQAAKTKSEELQ